MSKTSAYQKRISLGLCTLCGDKDSFNGRRCELCAEKEREKQRNRYFLNKNNNYHENRRKKLVANGLCNNCGKTKDVDTLRCSICLENTRKRKEKLKKKVFEYYGNKCNCYGETIYKLLTIDHINNDGYLHRKKINSKSGSKFYLWIIKNSFPDFLQLLCWNCNCSKRINNGICPHKETDTSGLR